MEPLILALWDVIDILERIGDLGAIEVLTKDQELKEKNVQSRAAEALERIKNIDSQLDNIKKLGTNSLAHDAFKDPV